MSHKYGIEIPPLSAQAELIDDNNGNTLWSDVIQLKMQNNGVAFQILGTGSRAPPGWRKVTGHLVFDVKMDFTRKNCTTEGGKYTTTEGGYSNTTKKNESTEATSPLHIKILPQTHDQK